MIDALFNQPDYLAAKKELDAISLREQAIASNIANLETPGYKRLDVAPSFNAELERACATGNSQQIAALQPKLEVDPNATARSPDGNTVDLEEELLAMNQNTVAHGLETQFIGDELYRLKMAITGQSS
ncbi:MAG TPA: flagellar basal body rod protein FlgB [Candidatus Saccharimonadales bacterium]|nr:flagellar basal body rod protein FlgB [Candidatus Saccharimonadales bacterium]